VIIIEVTPLRNRKDDIPVLVTSFISDICYANGSSPVLITDEAIVELQKFNWSGNVRELHNVVERMIILCGDNITKEDVNLYVKP
jgi:DNA-binding NtrC family response regulator